MDFLSFREEITKYIFAEDMLQKADIIDVYKRQGI